MISNLTRSANRSFRPLRSRVRKEEKKDDFDQQVLDIARVTRVTKGGKRFSFRATVAVGNRKGRVGVGVAQGRDVAQAIQKASGQGRKKAIRVILKNASVSHEVTAKYNSAVVLLKPAPVGSGVKAGGPVRAISQLAGVENITAKLLSRTRNKINIARATIEALKRLRPEKEKLETNNQSES